MSRPEDALMCGFCTPGFVVTLKAMLDQNPQPSLDEVRQAAMALDSA